MHFLLILVFQLGVMTYTDMTAQSPETQAAVEHEVRVLLKVCGMFLRAGEQNPTFLKHFTLLSFLLRPPGVL